MKVRPEEPPEKFGGRTHRPDEVARIEEESGGRLQLAYYETVGGQFVDEQVVNGKLVRTPTTNGLRMDVPVFRRRG